MGKGLIYCHMCGEILDESTNKQIVKRDWATKKLQMLFDVCPSCAEKVEKMKFGLQRIKNRKKINYSSIIIRDFKPRKMKTVYDVLPYQLDAIYALEVPREKLVLRYKDGAKIYSQFQVEKWIKKSRKNLLQAMYLLYQKQTEDEKINRETKYANSVGFNKPDADFLTGMCRMYETGKTFTPAQYRAIESKLLKYVKQITLYINAERFILSN